MFKQAGGHSKTIAVGLVALGLALLFAASAFAAEAPTDSIAVERVDTKAWPDVRLRVVLPSELLQRGSLSSGAFELTENGVPVHGVKATPVAKGSTSLDVMLVIDVSGSMEGDPLGKAKAAAKQFLAEMRPADRVGLVAFSGKPAVVAQLTGDREAVAAAIDGLSTDHSTALYDAVALAAGSFKESTGKDRAIVLLSDGDDTDSGYTLSAVVDAVQRAGIPVYAARLGSDRDGARALGAVTQASGGRLASVADADGLASTFSGIARQITSPYDITYTSLRPPSKQLDLVITASSGKGRASTSLAVPSPDSVQSGPIGTAAPLPSPVWPFAVALLVFGAAGFFVFAVLLLMRPEDNAIGQLKYFEQLRASRGGSSSDLNPDSVRGKVVELAGTVAAKGGFDAAIRQALERAGLPLRPVEYMVMHSSAVIVVGVLVQLIGQKLLLTGLVVFLAALGPVLMLSVLADRRCKAFQEQLPDVLNLLASSLRAGWGLQQAVSVVVSELGAPAAPEFERVVTEARLGLPLEDALEKMAMRMESEDFKWAVTAIAIQREVGGNLSEVLDMVASTIRERATLRRQISSLTAEGRLSAIILIALPFVEGGALLVLNPGYFRPLVGSPYGIVTMLFGLMLLGVGIVWLRNVVKIEV